MSTAPAQPDAIWPELQRTAALDQARRLAQSIYVIPVLLSLLWIATPYPQDFTGFYVSHWLLALLSGVLRIHTHRRFAKLFDTHPNLLRAELYTAAIITSAASGFLYAHTLHAYGLVSWTFTLVMFFAVGCVSGGTISFTPTLKLLRIYVLLMLIPTMVAGAIEGGKEGYTFVGATAVLLLFLLVQGAALSKAYWSVLENKAMEAARTRELEVAHQTAEAARRTAEAANAAKSLFLANMSHEIRTPMHGILGMTEIAMHSTVEGERVEALQIVRTSAEALLHVLNDILDFSKIEAGKMAIEAVPFDVADLVREVRGVIEGRIRLKGLQTDWRVSPEVPARLLGDPTRLKQVLINLLGNATKFCEQGTVSLSVDWDSTGLPRFAVSDTGIGIPKEYQQEIFAAFAQADGSVTRKFGGTGLGLSICSELVRLMGGRIWVESEPGVGSTFLFTAALSCAEEEEPVKTAQPQDVQFTRQLSILLVEDNIVNQRLATRFLGARGHKVSVAGSGLDAIKLACAEQFDIILMDNHMPGMGGVEATSLIREFEKSAGRPRIPIVALTASAMRGDRERFLAAGMDSYLAKPFRAHELYATIAGLTE